MHGPIQSREQRPWRLQFAVARLIVASALLGAGIGCLLLAFSAQQSWASWPNWRRFVAFLQFLASGPLIVAGLLAPFHHMRQGAYVGFFLGIIAGIVALLTGVEWGSELPGVLWQLRYVIGFTLMAVVLGLVSVVQKVMANTKP